MVATIEATPQPDHSPPRVQILIDGLAGTTVVVYRYDGQGGPVPVRQTEDGIQRLTAGGAVVYDYEVQHNSTTQYTAVPDGSLSTFIASGYVTLAVSRPWLIHPGVPSFSRPVNLASVGGNTFGSSAVGYAVSERATPIVSGDGVRKAPASDLGLYTLTEADGLGLVNLFADDAPLLLQIPNAGARLAYRWISVGDISESAPLRPDDEARTWAFPILVIDRPVGGILSERSWADVVAENADWATVVDRYASWRDLVIDNRKPVAGTPIETGGGSTLVFTDNGDGTVTITGLADAVDNGDGTVTLSGLNDAVDNGDGTVTLT
jgi:hypothetical protein